MPVLPAALLVGSIAVIYVVRTSIKAPAMITFASPTTVVSAAAALFALVAVVVIITVGVQQERSLVGVLIVAGVVGALLLRLAGTTQGNRVVYERGAYRIPPGKLMTVIAIAVLCFVALIQQSP